MDTILKEIDKIQGLQVTSYIQNGTHAMCKIRIMPSDIKLLCERTKSGRFKNRDLHEKFINTIVCELEQLRKEELNASK